MTRSGFFIAILISALCTGCVMIIPTLEHVEGPTRGVIEQETLGSIRAGVTTREEVLLRLGEPDVVMRNERLFGYHWVTVWGKFFVAYGGAGGGGPLWQTRYLALFEFDEKGIVKRHEVKEETLFLAHPIIERSLDEMERW